MEIYTLSEKLIDTVIKELTIFKELIGVRDENKTDKYGFVPGLNMYNEATLIDEKIERIKEGIFKVMFIGSHKGGKTTAVSALCGKKLPHISALPISVRMYKVVFKTDEKVIIYKNKTDPVKGDQIKEEVTIEKYSEDYHYNILNNPDILYDIDYIEIDLSTSKPGNKLIQIYDCSDLFLFDTEPVERLSENADAIVYVINAVRCLDSKNVDYIKSHYANKNMKNIFFLVNHFDRLMSDDVDELKKYMEYALRDVFTLKDGSFDRDLFGQRVFYTNAKDSLKIRSANKTSAQFDSEESITDENTGIPDFERALGHYLNFEDRGCNEIISFIPELVKIYIKAENKLEKHITDNNIDSVKERAEKLLGILFQSITEINKAVLHC